MSNAEDSQHNFLPKVDAQLYMMDKGSSLTSGHLYSPEKLFGNPFLHTSSSKTPMNRTQQHCLSAKNDQTSPLLVISPNASGQAIQNQQSFENGSAQNPFNKSLSVDNVSNVNPPSKQTHEASYLSLTPWTTNFSDQGYSLTPSNIDALTVPVMPNQHSPLPTSAGPIHLTTRMHKVTPYHNTFSRLSPLQPKPFNKSHNAQGNQPDPVVPFTPKSPDEMLKSVSSKENRFKRTAEALHKSGLWDIAMKTGHLIKRNQELQKELEQFKMDALNFLKSVIKNPENRDFIKSVLNSALCAGAAESKKSVMTVVVSAAAAVAAVSVSDSVVCNGYVNGEGNCKTSVDEKSPSDLLSSETLCSISKEELVNDNRTVVA